MHWAEQIAKKIIHRNPNKEEYVCAAGISPSGSIHIGNFRDIATSYFVVCALRNFGKKARLLFSWDEYDRFRKVPSNVMQVQPKFDQYIGCPYIDIPDPFDNCHNNYAEHFEAEFMESIIRFGIDMDYRYQSQMYRSGKYVKQILLALQKRFEIYDILDKFKTQESTTEERNNYYPVTIYCAVCNHDSTKITSLSEDCKIATYKCACGHKGTFNFTENFNCKLVWKVDWPMRWMHEEVDFEPGGKDHASPTGSYQNSKIICEKIFNYPAPLFQGYEFIGIRGVAGKMSSSSGLNLTPGTLLKIYQPQIILWLYSKSDPNKAFDFCFDDGILRQYFEFDQQYNKVKDGTANELEIAIMKYCMINDEPLETVPMSLLVQMGSIVDFNVSMLELIFQRIGTPFTYEQFRDRLNRARFWLENCATENSNHLNEHRNWDFYNALDDMHKNQISKLFKFLNENSYSLDELKAKLYAIPKEASANVASDIKKSQSAFFSNVYQLLINKERGPRLYLFLFAIEKERYLHLLDFSAPQTKEELHQVVIEASQKEELPKFELCEPDSVMNFKDMIELDTFGLMDLRVCKVVKCTEIRKSHSCYKITVDDGLGTRTIISSIKQYYQPEELIGKKIMVIVNLKPTRIAGVTSQGMLLASTNSSCGCKIIFIDDTVPTGTAIQ